MWVHKHPSTTRPSVFPDGLLFLAPSCWPGTVRHRLLFAPARGPCRGPESRLDIPPPRLAPVRVVGRVEEFAAAVALPASLPVVAQDPGAHVARLPDVQDGPSVPPVAQDHVYAGPRLEVRQLTVRAHEADALPLERHCGRGRGVRGLSPRASDSETRGCVPKLDRRTYLCGASDGETPWDSTSSRSPSGRSTCCSTCSGGGARARGTSRPRRG